MGLKLKRIIRFGVALLVLAIGMVAYVSFFVIPGQDAEHARFYEKGRRLNLLLSAYAEAFQEMDNARILGFYSPDYRSPQRGQWSLDEGSTHTGTSVYQLIRGAGDFERSDLEQEVSRYLNGIESVAQCQSKIDLIHRTEDEQKLEARVKFILDGIDREGRLFQDRFFIRWTLRKETARPASDWKIVSDQLVEGVRVAGPGSGFRSIDPTRIGIEFRHQRDPRLDPVANGRRLKFGVIQHGFGGVAAVDYNNDGKPDLFFADGRNSRLFRNDSEDGSQDVRFSDVTSGSGLDGIGEAGSGFFADIDNDGWKDLVIIRYLAPSLIFHNDGDGTFSDRTEQMGFDLIAPAISAVFLDFDRDGFLDLYVAVYGDAFQELPRLPFFARNGAPNRLFRNEGGERFRDVTLTSGTGDRGWSLATTAADYDDDGYPDLVVLNDFGRKALYHNQGDGTFREVAKQAGVLDFSGGMGATFGDFDDDGLLDLYTSNINSNQRWFGEDRTASLYLRNVLRTKWIFLDALEFRALYGLLGTRWVELGQMVGEGNSLFRNRGDGTFEELKDSHTNRAGWSWGVNFLDIDNDSDLDIYAVNGWISNATKTDL